MNPVYIEGGESGAPERVAVKIIPKASQSGIIPDRRAQLLRRIDNAKSEVGRLDKLLDDIRADVLHLTTD